MPLSSHESHISFVFNDLSSQTLYQYQVIGYNDKDVQIFIDAERQASTKSQIQSSSIKLVEYTLQTQENNPEYMVDVKCVDLRTDKIFERKTSVSQTLIFDGLAMGAKFICEGTLRIGEEVSSFGSIETHTLEGILPKEALVEWDAPLESNGVIGEYVISAKLICDSTELVGHCLKECESLAEDLEFSTSSNTLQLKDLTPFGEYALKVRARTSTRKEFGPSFYPKILSLKGVSSSKIIVDFSYPCIVSGVTRFDVSALKSVQQKRRNHRAIKKRFEIGRKRFILEGLEGGHTYNIQVSARVDDCSSGKCLVRSEKSQVYLNCAFRCNDGSCINKKWDVRCDFIQDCMDGSDEKNCTCEPPHFFKCSNGYCLESWKQCDGKVDCNDMSDEAGCPGCPADQFQCKKSGKCVELKQTCDRKLDCPDGSDEHNCPYWKKSRFVCDGIWDCSGGEDERSCEKSTCSSTSEFTCKPRNPHFPNKESICIPLHKYCDGEKDCVDGSDETFGCECHRIGKFACASGDECTERLRVCDGTINCKDGSDEHDCRRYDNSSFIPSTTPTTTSTTTLSTTLPSSPNNIRHVYDDYEFYDYLESADQVMETPKEEKYPSGLKLRIYPEYQSISIGSDVVIMCRDESDHRHQVSWTRPKNCICLNITLTMERAGVYECKALKPLSPKTPLGVARAFVHMEYHP
ncbi:Uncharacterized protein FKW44_005623 [Caligus rogercresseyi]|uniref:Uncharacterized protein n=1 Tax=Caligus rogercresseyi TaxID=217165 RepID=A0A7T8KC74_CALRO|nr:Uncharacterized protein FKW44_005623 [Caligus rogercresseyi]